MIKELMIYCEIKKASEGMVGPCGWELRIEVIVKLKKKNNPKGEEGSGRGRMGSGIGAGGSADVNQELKECYRLAP